MIRKYYIKCQKNKCYQILEIVLLILIVRLVSYRPMAFLLGGVDSSLVAAISAKLIGQPIRTFFFVVEGSPDMKYARMVADHIGSNILVYFTEEEE